MPGYFFVLIVASIVGFFLHLFLFSSGIIQVDRNFRMKKLIVHARSLLFIWGALAVIFSFIFYSPRYYKIMHSVYLMKPEVFNFLYGIVFFAMLFFLYLTFYYVVDRSVSSRIMIEIDNSPEKKLTFQQIRGVYNADKKYENELQGMREGGFIKKEGNFYHNTLKGDIWANVVIIFKKILRLGEGG